MAWCRCGVQHYSRDVEAWRKRAGAAASLRKDFAFVLAPGPAAPAKGSAQSNVASEEQVPHGVADAGAASHASVVDTAQANDVTEHQAGGTILVSKGKNHKQKHLQINQAELVGNGSAAARKEHRAPAARGKAALNSLLAGTQLSATG